MNGNYTCLTPCKNNGICVGNNLCDCSASGGYTGPQCDIPGCASPCQNGGSCTGLNQCTCINLYTGPLCEIPDQNSSVSEGLIVSPSALIFLLFAFVFTLF